ncbi:hypothetical protein VTL71DRAFT_15953 [Oculimacula yallundae]|uniref:Cytochrome P450 n=1 Tax=Oculimacula yallundae TaxID=86028 RepID=A0ABR4CDN0_9HELO
MDDFYKPVANADFLPQGLISKIWHSIPIQPALLATLLLGPLLIFLTAQLLLIGAPEDPEKKEKDKIHNQWMVPFQPVPWPVLESFFGMPKRLEEKYEKASKDLNACNRYILSSPESTQILKSTISNLERNIPQMISFISTPIDHQPWEHSAQPSFISPTETSLNLISLLRSVTGHALLPAVFGHALLEKHPSVLQDVFEVDAGRQHLLKKLPPWTPWPGVVKAHMARFRVWRCLDELQKVLDATVEGMGGDASWGDLEDVSEFVWKRNGVYREHGFKVKERADITILHSLLTTPTLVPIWLILHILSTPSLLALIRAEIAPYAKVSKPFSIGTISEAPKLVLDLEGLAEKCPLLNSSFLETLRLVDPSWDGAGLKDGEIAFPETFDAKRFLPNPDPSSKPKPTTEEGADDDNLSKSYGFIQHTSIALVAGILTFWDFVPPEKSTGLIVIPEKVKRGGVAVPADDVRVKVRRRKFEWMD